MGFSKYISWHQNIQACHMLGLSNLSILHCSAFAMLEINASLFVSSFVASLLVYIFFDCPL